MTYDSRGREARPSRLVESIDVGNEEEGVLERCSIKQASTEDEEKKLTARTSHARIASVVEASSLIQKASQEGVSVDLHARGRVIRTFEFLGGVVERPDGGLDESFIGIDMGRKGTGLGWVAEVQG
jgi:hypothetical protein